MAVGPAGFGGVQDAPLFSVDGHQGLAEFLAAGVLEFQYQSAALQLQHEGVISPSLLPVVGEHGGVVIIVVQGHGLQVRVGFRVAAGADHRSGEGVLPVHQAQGLVIPAIIGKHMALRLLLGLLMIQPVQTIQQAVGHDFVAQVAGVVHIIEVLPLGDHPVFRVAKLGGHRLQHIHHGQLVPVADGGQAALQVPVVGEHRKQQDHRRVAGATENVAHQTLVEHTLGLVPGVVHREFHHHQIRLNASVPGDVPVIAHEPGLRGGASHPGFDVADVCAVFATQTFAGQPGIAVFLQGHGTGALGDGSPQESNGHFLPCPGPAEEGLHPRVVPRAEEGPGDHLPVATALRIHGGVRVHFGNLESVIYITLDGRRRHIRHGGKLKTEFPQPGVEFAPVQPVQGNHPFRPVGGKGEAVAAAGAAVALADQAEAHLQGRIGGGNGHTDAVHQLPEAGHIRQELQDCFVLHPAGDPGSGGQPVAADENGVDAPAVILGNAAHLFVQKYIKPRPLFAGVLGCHRTCHRNDLLYSRARRPVA